MGTDNGPLTPGLICHNEGMTSRVWRVVVVLCSVAAACVPEGDPGPDCVGLSCGEVCGDGTCDPGESSASCPADCDAPAACGDGVCQAGENPGSCPDDCDDPCWGPDETEPNDSMDQADPLNGSARGSICPGDDDFWVIDIDPDATLITVTVTYDMAESDLDVDLMDGAGVLLDGSYDVSGFEVVVTMNPGTNRLFLLVYPFDTPVPGGAGYLAEVFVE